ncbi:hypothetical protein I314_00753 [Cryptococcus bacillisporus CA1873]|uniref:HNH nuclease domain-containing protein n=1 Tax=Cryptococcus bacillisporus CA1873 TaxID=1296111 RepID=A0ABR5BHK1_CRYGA|nr:hypothetical protein I314_00753 [Cryptococcus bacillisporus CA1873]|eukprot:KIR68335.1 hypothetical protein I314_00753 [Cryptococcus gattii CA1873]
MLALLAELLAKQTKQSAFQERYMPQGIPHPKATNIPHFRGPLGDADSVLTHLRSLQQLLQSHALLTPMDDKEMEERRWATVIEIANNLLQCAGLIGWVECDGQSMEKDSMTTWDDWSAAFKAKAMPSHWEFHESRTLFRLSLHEVSPESWRKFDNAVILHCSHLYGTHLYPNNKQIADFYWAACPEHLFLHLVDKSEFQSDDLDTLCTLMSSHIDQIVHEDTASRTTHCTVKTPLSSAPQSSDNAQLPHPVFYYHDPTHPLLYYRSLAGQYICEVF